jgi:hypothetical protein
VLYFNGKSLIGASMGVLTKHALQGHASRETTSDKSHIGGLVRDLMTAA